MGGKRAKNLEKDLNVLLGERQNFGPVDVELDVLNAAGLRCRRVIFLRGFNVVAGAVIKQLEVVLKHLVKALDLRLRELRVMTHQQLVRVLALPGIFMLRLNHVSQPRLLNQIPLILLERLKFRNHVELHLAGRAEVRNRRPVHVETRAGLRFEQKKLDELGERRPPRSELSLFRLLIRVNRIH